MDAQQQQHLKEKYIAQKQCRFNVESAVHSIQRCTAGWTQTILSGTLHLQPFRDFDKESIWVNGVGKYKLLLLDEKEFLALERMTFDYAIETFEAHGFGINESIFPQLFVHWKYVPIIKR